MAGHLLGTHRVPTEAGPMTAVLVMGRDGRVRDLDAGAERLFGYPRNEALGALMSELIIPPRLREAHEAALCRLRETGAAPILDTAFAMPALCRDGREVLVELVVSRIRHGDEEAFAGTMRPLSGQPP